MLPVSTRFAVTPLLAAAGLLFGLGAACAGDMDLGEEPSVELRHRLVDGVLAKQGITDARVLAAMRRVPRHLFVPEALRRYAYRNRPLPIGEDQTISQPFIVAYMTQLAGVQAHMTVLEIGTGSGYQAAVLAELADQVYTIEIIASLGRRADRVLQALGYRNVHVRIGDGYEGWPEHAPFDAILVTAAPGHVPQPLVDQLAVGARLVIPVGDRSQELRIITKTADGAHTQRDLPVLFVPMTGAAQAP